MEKKTGKRGNPNFKGRKAGTKKSVNVIRDEVFGDDIYIKVDIYSMTVIHNEQPVGYYSNMKNVFDIIRDIKMLDEPSECNLAEYLDKYNNITESLKDKLSEVQNSF